MYCLLYQNENSELFQYVV